MPPPRILVLVKRSSYRTFVEEQKDARVSHLLAKGDPTVRRMQRSHDAHKATIAEVEEAIERLGARGRFVVGPRHRVDAARFELVVTVGGDGTLLAASHQVGPKTPILGVNSSPASSVGFFCAAKKGTVHETLAAALDGSLKRVRLSRMRVEINDRCVHTRVLNEALFSHSSPAATTRYILEVTQGSGKTRVEEQRSSGLWIGPAAGSTAAQRSAGGRILPLTSSKIQFVVREPYVRLGARLAMPRGLVDARGHVTLRSKMKDALLFLDGHHIVHNVDMGDVVTLRHSEESLVVLGLRRPV